MSLYGEIGDFSINKNHAFKLDANKDTMKEKIDP
jgi:hypothetical protein